MLQSYQQAAQCARRQRSAYMSNMSLLRWAVLSPPSMAASRSLSASAWSPRIMAITPRRCMACGVSPTLAR